MSDHLVGKTRLIKEPPSSSVKSRGQRVTPSATAAATIWSYIGRTISRCAQSVSRPSISMCNSRTELDESSPQIVHPALPPPATMLAGAHEDLDGKPSRADGATLRLNLTALKSQDEPKSFIDVPGGQLTPLSETRVLTKVVSEVQSASFKIVWNLPASVSVM